MRPKSNDDTDRRPSVLVVDDEKNIRITLSDILEEEGYAVSTAETGEKAVRMYSRKPFDFVLMDVRMPGIDGVEAFRQMQQQREDSNVVLMSAYSLDHLEKLALREGALAFLRKPLDVENLARLFRRAKATSILLVEQDEQLAGPFASSLRAEGYRPRTVEQPFQAIELAERIPFEIIFIDAKQPAGTGLDLHLTLKAVSPQAETVLLAAGGEEEQQVADEALRESAFASIGKPPEIEEALKVIRRIEKREA